MNDYHGQPKPRVRVGVLFLKRKRPGFDPDWGATIEAGVRQRLAGSRLDGFYPEPTIVDGVTLAQAIRECDRQGCTVYVAIQPTMSDGRLTPVLGRMIRSPVVFWATPEKQTGGKVSSCSLVGAHTFMANLAQVGHRFDFVYGAPDDPTIIDELERAVMRSHACSVMDGACAALVGYHAPGFSDMHADPATLGALGVELLHIGLREFEEGVQAVPADDALADVEFVRNAGIPIADGITDADLLLDSRYYLHMKDLMDRLPLHALAIRDWPELSATSWPYLAMTRLASEGYALACEGDVDGALACRLAYAAGCGVCYVSDWLEHDRHRITLWHTGAAPLQLCAGPDSARPPRIGVHFNNRKPLVVDATVRSDMPVTLFRLWHMQGRYLFTAIEGTTVEPARHLAGTNGAALFEAVDIPDYFMRMVRAGMPHHPILVEGHVKGHLSAVAGMLGIDIVE